eukprot:scaffold56111_cov27-Tisochrysis_lutea.AAC.3
MQEALCGVRRANISPIPYCTTAASELRGGVESKRVKQLWKRRNSLCGRANGWMVGERWWQETLPLSGINSSLDPPTRALDSEGPRCGGWGGCHRLARDGLAAALAIGHSRRHSGCCSSKQRNPTGSARQDWSHRRAPHPGMIGHRVLEPPWEIERAQERE